MEEDRSKHEERCRGLFSGSKSPHKWECAKLKKENRTLGSAGFLLGEISTSAKAQQFKKNLKMCLIRLHLEVKNGNIQICLQFCQQQRSCSQQKQARAAGFHATQGEARRWLGQADVSSLRGASSSRSSGSASQRRAADPTFRPGESLKTTSLLLSERERFH